jgi:hypothetical protein
LLVGRAHTIFPLQLAFQSDQRRLLLIMLRPTRLTLAEVPLADLSFTFTADR